VLSSDSNIEVDSNSDDDDNEEDSKDEYVDILLSLHLYIRLLTHDIPVKQLMARISCMTRTCITRNPLHIISLQQSTVSAQCFEAIQRSEIHMFVFQVSVFAEKPESLVRFSDDLCYSCGATTSRH
jgi:hypothetical protein